MAAVVLLTNSIVPPPNRFPPSALEAIFISMVSSIQSEIEVFETFVTQLLLELEERIEPRQLKELLQYTKKLSKFEKDVLSIQGAITEVLEQGR